MRYTLLEMVQRILESMDSDEVNSYSDTVESTAVANIIKETYYYLTSRMDLPSQHTFFQLTPSGDNTKPTLMTVPQNVLDIDYIKYKEASGSDTTYEYVIFKDLENFIHENLSLEESRTDVGTMTIPLNGSNFTFKFENDKNPRFYTTIDDTRLLFDAYDSSVDTTLQSSKTLCYGRVAPSFTMSDTFVPSLDPDQFQLLLNEAKSQAFVELKQMDNNHSNRRASKMFITTQRTKHNVPSKIPEVMKRKGYGRKR